ncbi:hypothetical protein Tco_0515143 [Tanacetum coccineum]
MANEHVPSFSTTRSDDQIFLFNGWVPIGKEHPSDTKVLTMKMEILLEPTSNKLLVKTSPWRQYFTTRMIKRFCGACTSMKAQDHTVISNDVDIENMTIAEYNLYVAKQGLGMNPLKPIHITPPNDDYVTPATKSNLDELLEEFGYEILNVTMVDDEADFNPTKDLEELERLLAKEPQSNFTEIHVHSVIINTEPFIHTQLMSPLYGVFKTSKPCKVDRDIISPGSHTGCATCGGAWILNKLRGSIANRTSWMLYWWLVMLHVMLDIVRGSRLGAWLRACCLFLSPSKSKE